MTRRKPQRRPTVHDQDDDSTVTLEHIGGIVKLSREILLVAVHRGTVVPLDHICEKYLGLGPKVARQRAVLNTLPFPTFRLNDSAKAPIMVKVSDLAKHIDDQHARALRDWEHSQV